MTNVKRTRGIAVKLLVCAAAMWAYSARPAAAQLKPNDHVAIIGDSITEQKLYSMLMEDYLLMCKPVPGLRATQLGWSGETSWGFAARAINDALPFHPTVATTCYGMNDGGYSPETPEKEKQYHDAQTDVVKKLKAGGVRFIVVGSPGAVDTETFRRDPAAAAMYNKTLATERDIARKVAQEQGVTFADVYDPMIEVMEKMKSKFGKDYALAGGDGVHPDFNGHLVMAYAFLKALGCDGNIGTITIDLAAKKAEATEGHKILSVEDGSVEVQSSKYPFCFQGDPKATSATTGVIEFLPFNQDLNRFNLIVKGGKGNKFKVTWGKSSKEFSAAQLAKGINLAAEFLDNPFSQPFRNVQEHIRRQQDYETPLVKNWMHAALDYAMSAKLRGPYEKFIAAAIEQDKTLADEAAAAVVPVTYTIKVEAVQ